MNHFKLNHKLLFLLMIVSTSFLIYSCTNDDFAETEFEKKSDSKDLQENLMFDFAKTLSILVNKDPLILEDLQEFSFELPQKGYYETEFFVSSVLDKPLVKSGKRNALFKNELSDVNRSFENQVQNLRQQNGLSVLLENFSKSDKFSNRIYIDDGFDDSDPEATIKYYFNGKLGMHKISKTLNKKVFIVRISEGLAKEGDEARLVGTGDQAIELNKALFKEITPDASIKKSSCCYCPPEYIPPHMCPWYCEYYYGCSDNDGGDTESDPCERNSHSGKDIIYRFRTTNDHDPWRGKGEFFPVAIWASDVSVTLVNGTYVVTGNPLGHVKKGVTGGVSGNNSWYYPNYTIFTWNEIGDGNRMKIIWFEQDSGGLITLKIPLNGGTLKLPDGTQITMPSSEISFSIRDGDDHVGEDIVEYCDGLKQNFTHTPGGGLTFQMDKL